jgi:hypothetical protein
MQNSLKFTGEISSADQTRIPKLKKKHPQPRFRLFKIHKNMKSKSKKIMIWR